MMDTKATKTVFQPRPEELAERCLRSNSHLAHQDISCEYVGGVLILRGHLPTYYRKQLAQAAVGQLEGMDQIDNQIEVVTPTTRTQ